MINQTFGGRLKQKRLEMGISQEELAKKCGFKGFARISHYEKGIRYPRPAEILKLATALSTERSYLLFGEHVKVNPHKIQDIVTELERVIESVKALL